MRRFASLVVLVLAIACGVGASFVTYRLLKERKVVGPITFAAQKPARAVIVAAVPITYGTVLRPEHLKSAAWPADAPKGSFHEMDLLVGRAAISELVIDEPILDSKLAPVDAMGGLSAVIPRGKRAVSVRVNEIIGVAGFVLPRTRVDVLVSINPQGDKSRAASRVILQNVMVLAAGEKTERDEEGKPQKVNVITLLVDPKESEKLTLASHEGEIQLALRNSLDLDSVTTPGAVLGSMVQGAPVKVTRAAKAPREEPAVQTVEVIRGSQRTVESFK
ncbi:MAG TPA: Flp pilus assembly protein CpaB [Candidatus Polarisedimenticolia bacterium]|nr:Flp pilus assembly protein CpaB [Candidatus Polarisedimenticolia bacterium]